MLFIVVAQLITVLICLLILKLFLVLPLIISALKVWCSGRRRADKWEVMDVDSSALIVGRLHEEQRKKRRNTIISYHLHKHCVLSGEGGGEESVTSSPDSITAQR